MFRFSNTPNLHGWPHGLSELAAEVAALRDRHNAAQVERARLSDPTGRPGIPLFDARAADAALAASAVRDNKTTATSTPNMDAVLDQIRAIEVAITGLEEARHQVDHELGQAVIKHQRSIDTHARAEREAAAADYDQAIGQLLAARARHAEAVAITAWIDTVRSGAPLVNYNPRPGAIRLGSNDLDAEHLAQALRRELQPRPPRRTRTLPGFR